jgi:hypothetical protein
MRHIVGRLETDAFAQPTNRAAEDLPQDKF